MTTDQVLTNPNQQLWEQGRLHPHRREHGDEWRGAGATGSA